MGPAEAVIEVRAARRLLCALAGAIALAYGAWGTPAQAAGCGTLVRPQGSVFPKWRVTSSGTSCTNARRVIRQALRTMDFNNPDRTLCAARWRRGAHVALPARVAQNSRRRQLLNQIPGPAPCEFLRRAGLRHARPVRLSDEQLLGPAQRRPAADRRQPPGALVFWTGGTSYGHVAVSIGGGQVIGTLSYNGQRRPVSQYSIGYISGFLGWARAPGSGRSRNCV